MRSYFIVVLSAAVAAFLGVLWHAAQPSKPKTERAQMASIFVVSLGAATGTPAPLERCSPVVAGSGRQPLIDDFEDGDARVLVTDNRAGYWLAYSDGTGQQVPRKGVVPTASRIPGGRGDSVFGLHSTGTRFAKWGAILAVELSPRRCYDASFYAGVSFWARGRATLRVAAKMTQVVGEEFGGSCTKDCSDTHGALRTLTPSWTKYVLYWSELQQRGFGAPVPFDPRSLYSIEFAILERQPPYDFWLDDVAFLER